MTNEAREIPSKDLREAGGLKGWIRNRGRDLLILALALRDARVGRQVKGLIVAVIAYVASPVDLVSELVVPGIGLVDDAVIVTALLSLALRLLPEDVRSDLRVRSRKYSLKHVVLALGLVIALWLAALGALLWWIFSSADQ